MLYMSGVVLEMSQTFLWKLLRLSKEKSTSNGTELTRLWNLSKVPHLQVIGSLEVVHEEFRGSGGLWNPETDFGTRRAGVSIRTIDKSEEEDKSVVATCFKWAVMQSLNQIVDQHLHIPHAHSSSNQTRIFYESSPALQCVEHNGASIPQWHTRGWVTPVL